MSLQSILQEQQQRRSEQRKEIAKAKREVLQSGRKVTKGLLMTVNREVALVHKNQLDLEEQAKELAAEAERFSEQSARWLSAYQRLNHALDQIAGIEKWTKQIESKMESITDSLEKLSGLEQTLDNVST